MGRNYGVSHNLNLPTLELASGEEELLAQRSTPRPDAVLGGCCAKPCETCDLAVRSPYQRSPQSSRPPFNYISRVDRGGCPPRPPTDPGVPISGTRLFRIMDSLRGGRSNGRLVPRGVDSV